jgi:hypothetical protein
MDDVWLGQCRNKYTQDHLIPLAPGKEVKVDYGCRGAGSCVGIRNSLGKRRSGAIKKAIGVLAFDICENLGFPGIEVAFGKLNTKVMIHIWDDEDNSWLDWWWVRL